MSERPALVDLSRREREVVELVGQGRTYEQAAQRLGISRSAVTARLGRAYSKLGVGNVREAVLVLKRMKKSVALEEDVAPRLFVDADIPTTWWRDQFVGRMRAQRHLRRTRESAGGGSFTGAEWAALCERYDHRCGYCGASGPLDADHRIPVARGGSSNIDNIIPACRPCNGAKGTRTEEEFRATRRSPAA